MEWLKWLISSRKRQSTVVHDNPPPVLRGPSDEALLLCRFVEEEAGFCSSWTFVEPNPGEARLINAGWRVCISYEWRERELTVCVMNAKLYDMYSGITSSGWDLLAAYDSCPYITSMFAETKQFVRKFEMSHELEARRRVAAVIRILDSKSDTEIAEAWRAARAALRARIEASPGKNFSAFLNEDGTVDLPSRRR